MRSRFAIILAAMVAACLLANVRAARCATPPVADPAAGFDGQAPLTRITPENVAAMAEAVQDLGA